MQRAAEQYEITEEEQQRLRDLPYWPIPSQMLKDSTLSRDRREQLAYLNDWHYKQLSSQSHGSVPGLVMRAAALIPGADPDERA